MWVPEWKKLRPCSGSPLPFHHADTHADHRDRGNSKLATLYPGRLEQGALLTYSGSYLGVGALVYIGKKVHGQVKGNSRSLFFSVDMCPGSVVLSLSRPTKQSTSRLADWVSDMATLVAGRSEQPSQTLRGAAARSFVFQTPTVF